ncbi:MAG: LPD38 domain-containing protein, partial [Sphingomonadaceae bacterium]
DAKGVAQVATPTVLRPITDLVVNQNFAGTPVAKEKSPFGYNKPAYANGRESTPSYWTTAAKALNDWTGGDSVKPGAANLSPEQLAYLLKGYVMPGITQTVDKVAGQAMSRKDTPIDQIVGVSKFFGTIDENERSRAAFETARKDREKAEQYSRYFGIGDRKKAAQVLKDWGNGDEKVGRKLLTEANGLKKNMKDIADERKSALAFEQSERDKRLARADERMQRTQAVYLRNRAALVDAPDE